jgi:hypothetical protein
LALALLGGATSHAEQVDSAALNMKFSVLLWKKYEVVAYNEKDTFQNSATVEPDLLLYYRNKDEMLPLALMKGQRTEIFSYSGPSTLLLYTRQQGADGEFEYQPYVETTLAEGTDEVLLFLLHEEARHFMHVLDMSSHALKPGGLLFFNMTNQPIALKIGGDNPLPVKPFKQASWQFSKGKLIQSVTIAAYDEDNWTVVYRRRMVLKTDQRYVGFFSKQGGAHNLLLLR